MALHITPDNKFKKLIIIGDRLLIRPTQHTERTDSGLYLPPGVQEKEKVQQGYIIKNRPWLCYSHAGRRRTMENRRRQGKIPATPGPRRRPGHFPYKRRHRNYV